MLYKEAEGILSYDFHDVLVRRKYNTPTQLRRAIRRVERWKSATQGLTTRRARRGVVPAQNLRIPSSVKTRYAQWNEFRYWARASRLCIRVLMTLRRVSEWVPHTEHLTSTYSRGIVVYTVTSPAMPPIPKVIALGSGCPGLEVPWTNCLRVM